MVMMFVGGVVLMFEGLFRTIPTVGNLRGGSFSFGPEPLWVMGQAVFLGLPPVRIIILSNHSHRHR